jgi:hypothetical protein
MQRYYWLLPSLTLALGVLGCDSPTQVPPVKIVVLDGDSGAMALAAQGKDGPLPQATLGAGPDRNMVNLVDKTLGY